MSEPGSLVAAMAQTADEARYLYRLSATPGEWYVLFPNWVVYKDGRSIEQFAAEFEESSKRMAWIPNMPIGFETDAPDGGVYRYRLSWLGGQDPATTPEEID